MRNPKDIEINGKTLETILEEHKHWINKDCDDCESMRADLSYANLSEADLREADLSGADLSWANLAFATLHGADLRNADLVGVNLAFATLIEANFRYANLTEATLHEADLRNADLSNAVLYRTILVSADFSNAKFCKANLVYANFANAKLCGADLYEADFYGANLTEANLSYAKGNLINFRKGKILTESIIGYKKCYDHMRDPIIVTLEIPVGAIVFSINGDKCRTNKAKVIAINDKDGNDVYRAFSTYQYMSYYVGDIFNMTNFDLAYNAECSTGIHFFMTREEAEAF